MFSLFEIIGLILLLAIGVVFILGVAAVVLGAILFVLINVLAIIPFKEKKQDKL